ncbi:MAG: type III-B CRISPR-associated protein Cas10/Cmr2, partial [Caldisphaera sp.]
SAIKNENLKYHLLYFLSPLIWYEIFPNTPPVADTRVPTHTIFDHATATAAMLNIINCKNNKLEFNGSIAILEFPSIQEYISYSRKTRDLWASSWLSSALLWKSIEPFVKDYGPDVVLRPELSLNHFFVSWLYNNVNNKDIKDIVINYAKKYANLNDNPKVSMMSEKIVLLLPENKDSVKKKLIEEFYNGWKKIAEDTLDNWKNINYIKEAIEKPPIDPVVNAIDINDAYNEYIKKISKGNDLSIKCGMEYVPIEYSLLFEYLYRKVSQYDKVKRSYGSLISNVVYEITKNNYEICTMCGVLPSVLYYHDKNDSIDDNPNNIDDRLCPYCAVKRNLKRDILDKVFHDLGLHITQEKSRYPSTSEFAMYNYAYYYTEKINSQSEINESVFNDKVDNLFINPLIAENLAKCYSGVKSDCGFIDKDLLKKYGNIYYAIIKADGDFMGKGYWSGVLKDQHGDPIGIDQYLNYLISYIKEISNKSSDDLNRIN